MATVNEVFEALMPVMDPEHPISITEPRMGIVTPDYIRVNADLIRVRFKPTVPQCPMGGLIGILIRHRLEEVYPKTKLNVSLLPGSHTQEAAVNDMISNDEKYRNIITQMKDRGML